MEWAHVHRRGAAPKQANSKGSFYKPLLVQHMRVITMANGSKEAKFELQTLCLRADY
jgi:hypothetical protein